MKKFLVIDGNSIMNRAFYGLNANMTSSYAGIHTNALYGFLNIYWMILDKVMPDYVAVSFDLKAPTFRHKMYAEYKGTRKGMPQELAEQMPVIKEILTAMNVPILQLEGYEADDILGTVAKSNTENNIFTYILTGDKDSFQLISDTTSIIIPTTRFGKTEYTIYTPELLKEKNNIEPYQVVEIKSLMGDSSDNIPGVKGIGEKTAYSLIWDYTTLEEIYENIDSIHVSEKVREKLINGKDIAFLSKELATINVNVPIEIDYTNCEFSDVNLEMLYRLFKKLEFNKFLSKYDFSKIEIIEEDIPDLNKNTPKIEFDLKKVIVVDNQNVTEYIECIKNVFEEDEISYLINGITNEDNIYINNKNVFAIYSNIQDVIYVINIDSLKESSKIHVLDDLFKAFAMSKSFKMGYNIKPDIRYILTNYTKDISNFSFDLMIAYYLLDSAKSNYLIDYILNDLYKIVIEKETSKEEKQLSLFEAFIDDNDEFLNEKELKNIAIYLKGIFLSYNIIKEKLQNVNMLKLFEEIEMPLTETLAAIECAGMYIDKDKLNEFDIEITEILETLEKEIYEYAGEEFNINSPQQLGVILFEKLNLPTVKKNKTGYSTDKSVLEELSEFHPIIDKVLEYRQVMKLKGTFVDGLKDKIGEDGRIHTTFMQALTSTGRLSSVEPNLQNIPVRMELGSKIRTFFTAENDNIIVDADYSQIELRVLAHISKDETMINAFNDNIDVHKVTASQVFGVSLDDVTPIMRTHAKAVNFGIVYGISDFGLAKNIGTSRKEAKQYIDNYLEKYKGIRYFMQDIVMDANNQGYVSTIFGRRRYIPELKSKNRNVIQFGERVAMNTPIQGTAADIIKIAMNNIYRKLKENNLKSKLIMQVHDELIIESCQEEVDKVKEIMKTCMENVVNLKVKLDVDLNTGKSWYDAK